MITVIITALICSFALSVAVGLIIIPILRRLKAGQTIKRNGPVWHLSKEGVPTMGGFIFIVGMLITISAIGFKSLLDGEYAHFVMLLFALIYGIIGFLDDYQKVKKRVNTGLTSIQKFVLQLIVAVVFILLLRNMGYLTPNLYVPFIHETIILPEPLYLVFAAFVIVAIVNAFNLTDGVDGLLTGVTLPVAVFFVAVSVYWGMLAQGIFAAALTGGLAAFLIFNFNPAKVFMGDTGSLFLGGCVCALLFAFDMPLIFLPLGIVYIIENLSVVIQVLYFKITHGKRFFKMAPIHHHFEKSGWNERKVFAVFTFVSAIFSLIAWLGVMERYIK
ncbi:MAG: phospho-N-acetylmuramoyl-pentapeptide-transferase [Clostridiales bacterium]|jgi:phospho-N-acetylmuramoyl-pentapeptide-transferase|nr:phospho-N-acetylmuramoyl-pentapeptide-transferase [Clostridiales bacterium]